MTLAAALMAVATIQAQSLAGRTYYNANIMAGEAGNMVRDMDKGMGEFKVKAYADFEKKKGRKPSDAEKSEIDKRIKQAHAKAEAMFKGMVIKVFLEFKTDKDAVWKVDMKVDEGAMKTAGVGWMKRKILKTAFSLAPSTHKATYNVQGAVIIMDDGGEKDTLRMSDDGKYLYGKFDQKTNFRLTRTQ